MQVPGLKEYATEAKRLREQYLEDEEDIYRRLSEGDDSVRDRLVDGNLLLVLKIAYDYKNRGLPLFDLVSEGNMALINAAGIFKIEYGSKFSTYVGVAIRRRIHMVLATRGSLIKSTNSCGVQRAIKVRRWANNQTSINGEEPTIEEINEEFPDFSELQIKNYMLSLVEKVSGTEEWNVAEDISICTPEVSSEFRRKELGDYLEKLMTEKLDERTARIVKMRVGIGCEPMVLNQIAQQFGLTRERIRQIYMQGLRKLKEFIDPAAIGHIHYQREVEEQTHGVLK